MQAALDQLGPAPDDDEEVPAEEGVIRLAVAGRPNVGKSTLMNLIGCLDTPNEGEYWLNGQMVLAYDLGSPAVKAGLAASKFKDWPKFASLARGHIALQDHGNVVSYRSIRIRELK